MKKLFVLFLFIVSAYSVQAYQAIRFSKEEGTEFRSHRRSRLSFHGNSVTVLSAGSESGFLVDGKWDLSGYSALKFKVTNNDSVHPIQICCVVTDSSCKVRNFTRSAVVGKADHLSQVMPKETKEITMYLPAPLPHPEVNQIFYDNFIVGKARNTPYSRGCTEFSYDINLKDVTMVGIGVRAGLADISYTVSDICIVEGKQKPLPKWMNMDADHFFPFIDRYGQFRYENWPGKIRSDSDLEKARKAEEKDLAVNPGPEEWSKFGGWKNGPKYEATGQFYVKKIAGKWWMIDPEGYLFWSHGVVRVTPSSAVTPLDGHKFYFSDLPKDESDPFYKFYYTYDELLKPYYTARGIKETYDFSCANLYRKYGENYREIWYELAHKRLRSWGLNTIANSSDHALCLMDRTVYNERVDLGSSVEGYPEWPILEGSTGWWKFIDPFDDLFETCVRAHLEAEKRELDDPWCLGFFVDNEIKWGKQEHLATLAFMASAAQASKKTLINFLIEKYHNIESLNKVWNSNYKDWRALLSNRQKPPKLAYADLCDFSLRIVEKYFSTVRRVFKQIAPNKLYMGCRFSGSSCPDFVVRIAGKYCDVMSYNRYAFDQASFSLPLGIDLPMMIGEFHFGAMDRGLFHTGLLRVDSQKERGEMYEFYIRSCLENPCIIGTNWHQFSDQPTTGRFDGENFQVGFTDVCDTPYAETICALRRVGSSMYHIRYGK